MSYQKWESKTPSDKETTEKYINDSNARDILMKIMRESYLTRETLKELIIISRDDIDKLIKEKSIKKSKI